VDPLSLQCITDVFKSTTVLLKNVKIENTVKTKDTYILDALEVS